VLIPRLINECGSRGAQRLADQITRFSKLWRRGNSVTGELRGTVASFASPLGLSRRTDPWRRQNAVAAPWRVDARHEAAHDDGGDEQGLPEAAECGRNALLPASAS
jgi:hypothetical protein